ncbi:MAG: hypothetical protein NVSMB52_04300 [Chloroflexota bacterium]
MAYVGSVEIELVVRYASRLDRRSAQLVLRSVDNAIVVARSKAKTVEQKLPLVQRVSDVPTLPPVSVAPFGTGPVTKSPSLMTIDSPQVMPYTDLDQGEFRSGPEPRVVIRTASHAALFPSGGISRYARAATVGGVDGLYNTTTIFNTVDDAERSLHNFVAVNSDRRDLLRYTPQLHTAILVRLRTVDAAVGWHGTGETILVLRYANVLTVLAQTQADPFDLALVADRLLETVPTWFHAAGTDIVDAAGIPVHLAGLNWYGFEEHDFVVGGLDYRPYGDILRMMKVLGYNSIRLPFSEELVQRNPLVKKHLGANPELVGMHALDIMDRIIAAAGAYGLSVILDNHRSDAGWSSQENGLWYTAAYPDSVFTQDWAFLAKRYASTNVVVGADLRNEPHGAATWGSGDPTTDWHMAAEHTGDAVLQSNPNVLVFVEGVQYYGSFPSYWYGGNLIGVATTPISLHFADNSSARNRLVYSAHDYGRDNCGIGCPWLNPGATYASLASIWDQYWGYISSDPAKSYAAPVWLGEFGTCNYQENCVSDTVPGSQGQWFVSLIRYISEHHLSWAYWSANGTQSTGGIRVYGALDWYGYFYHGWTAVDPLLETLLRSIRDGGTKEQSSRFGPHRLVP